MHASRGFVSALGAKAVVRRQFPFQNGLSRVSLSCVTSSLCSWTIFWPGNMFKSVLNRDHNGSMASVKTLWPSWMDWMCLPAFRTVGAQVSINVGWCWLGSEEWHTRTVESKLLSAIVTLGKTGVSPSWTIEFTLRFYFEFMGQWLSYRINSVCCLGNAQQCPAVPFKMHPGTFWQNGLRKGLDNVWHKEESFWLYRQILFMGNSVGQEVISIDIK